MSINKIDAVKQVAKFEKQFSCHHYNGGGQKDFVLKGGAIPVMISAPHSINQFREGQLKWADKMTGGIALHLHKTTGCHVIYSARYSKSDPNYDSNENDENQYQTKLLEYIKTHDIRVLIDLHGAAASREYAVEMGTAPIRDSNGSIAGDENCSLHGRTFIADLVRYTFDFVFRDVEYGKKEIWQNKIFDAGSQNTVTKYISENSNCSCIQLEINGFYRDARNNDEFSALLRGLSLIINALGNIDWTAKQIAAFRLGQSAGHKPQDKVELCDSKIRTSGFKENSLLYICSYLNGVETVRLHKKSEDNADNDSEDASEYLFLTNRLIENLFGREWIQGEETKPLLKGAPIVMYEDDTDIYKIGLPKANQIERVYFSSELYKSKLANADNFEFIVFNRYADSRLYIDFSKSDYQDYGRVKDVTGKPAMKVMIPRYYRRLLGYLNTPLSVIRHEEFLNLQQRIKNEMHKFLLRIYEKEESGHKLSPDVLNMQEFKGLTDTMDKDVFKPELSEEEYCSLEVQLCADMVQTLKSCYEELPGEVFYRLKEDIQSDEHYKETLSNVTKIQKYFGMYDSIEILRIPRKSHANVTLRRRKHCLIDRTIDGILQKTIGNVKYSLRTEWTSETDDKNNVARLSPNMMSLIGVSENDKIVIEFGEKKEILRVLANNDLSDFQIGIPAPARKKLGMNSINDIVMVWRDMKHAFKRHSLEQTVAIIGMILAVFQVTNDLLAGTLLCIVFTPLVLYFVLNEERIKVK